MIDTVRGANIVSAFNIILNLFIPLRQGTIAYRDSKYSIVACWQKQFVIKQSKTHFKTHMIDSYTIGCYGYIILTQEWLSSNSLISWSGF